MIKRDALFHHASCLDVVERTCGVGAVYSPFSKIMVDHEILL